MTFRDRLRDEIAYSGLLLKEVAERAGISKRTLDTYVDSRAIIPPANTAVRLAQLFNVSVEYLVTGEKTEEKKVDSYLEKENIELKKELSELKIEIKKLAQRCAI